MLQNQKGFTLIELAIVIAILGIIAVVAIPQYVNMTTTARIGALEGACGALKGSVGTYIARNRGTQPTVNQLLTSQYLIKDAKIAYFPNTAPATATIVAISIDASSTAVGPTGVVGPTYSASITDGTDTFSGCDLTGLAASATATTPY